MSDWRSELLRDPLPALLGSGNEALVFFTRRDLLGEDPGPVECLWELPEVKKILKKQLSDGSWAKRGEHKHAAINANLIETWRNLRVLVDQYGFTQAHPAARAAAEYLFSCQTEAGDLRGVLANQYATYYTGAMLATLIEAGYENDPRLERGLDWLLRVRQSDGGWTIPLLTHKFDRATQYRLTTEYVEPVEPDRSKPFSHNWTGMVLRAFAVHPQCCRSDAIVHAGWLLKSRFFQADVYSSYQDPGYWLRFEYPFWWNNLVAALDTLTKLGFSGADEHIRLGLDWLREHQEQDGLWKVSYMKPERKISARGRKMRPWIGLAICRVFENFRI